MKNKPKVKKSISVKFETKQLEAAFDSLETSHHMLYKDINRSIKGLKHNSKKGSFIKNHKRKKEFKRFWQHPNLWKYDLNRRGDRLIYTRDVEELTIVCIILEWGPHDDYKNLMIFFPFIQLHYNQAYKKFYRR